MQMLTPETALELLAAHPAGGIDVRSEGEFERAGIAGFANAPILDNEERHLVGLCFAEQGQAAAIALGLKLTAARRDERVARWRAITETSPHGFAIVTCWRGGLRSRFACEWLTEAGIPNRRVEGGYQAMRRVLLRALDRLPPLLVLGGLTGSGKTDLLHALRREQAPISQIDLEALAHHRGSAFGAWPQSAEQPRQAWFENALATGLRGVRAPLLVEDESQRIGSLFLPPTLLAAKELAPRVLLEEPLENRTARIAREYVDEPLRQGVTPDRLQATLAYSVNRLQRSLGGALAQQLEKDLQAAFAGTAPHSVWIRPLLERYYDRTYHHSLARKPRKILFRGDGDACRQWLVAQADAGWPSLL